MQGLYDMLLRDLTAIGIDTPRIDIRGYSKTWYGLYNPQTDIVVVYPYRNSECTDMYDYDRILLAVIHECCHKMQWDDPLFVRYRGVMHDEEFHKLCNKFSDRAKALLRMRESRSESIIPSFTEFVYRVSPVC